MGDISKCLEVIFEDGYHISGSKQIINALRGLGSTPVLFISDSAHGDKVVFGNEKDMRAYIEHYPMKVDGHEFTTADDLVQRLDVNAYEGSSLAFFKMDW